MNLPVGNQNIPLDGKKFENNAVQISKAVTNKIKKKYSYIQDPGHGWLSVSHEDIKELGIKSLISQCSYMNSTRVFLEEDQDMKVFLDAAKQHGWVLEIKNSVVDKTAIRSYAAYNQDWIDAPFELGRTVYLLNGKELVVSEKIKTGWLLTNDQGDKYRVPRLNPLSRIFANKPSKVEEQVG
jgi:hypothetical protein